MIVAQHMLSYILQCGPQIAVVKSPSNTLHLRCFFWQSVRACAAASAAVPSYSPKL